MYFYIKLCKLCTNQCLFFYFGHNFENDNIPNRLNYFRFNLKTRHNLQTNPLKQYRYYTHNIEKIELLDYTFIQRPGQLQTGL